MTDSQVAVAQEHVRVGARGDTGGAGERGVPAGPVLLHPGGVAQASGQGRGDRATHPAAGGGGGRPGDQPGRPAPLPQPRAR